MGSSTATPRGAVDLGDGFALLRAMDNCPRPIRECEAEAIRLYIRNCDDDSENSSDASEDHMDLADSWMPTVIRWARVRLPNGQVARSAWKEDQKKIEARRARVVKVSLMNLFHTLYLTFN